MGFITLIVLVVLTLIYMGKFWDSKPAFIAKAAAVIDEHAEKVAFWGGAYALVAFLLTLALGYSGGDMIVRLAANALVFLMALPLAMEEVTRHLGGKLGPSVMDEVRNLGAWATRQEKYLGYAGVAVSLILFGSVFR